MGKTDYTIEISRGWTTTSCRFIWFFLFEIVKNAMNSFLSAACRHLKEKVGAFNPTATIIDIRRSRALFDDLSVNVYNLRAKFRSMIVRSCNKTRIKSEIEINIITFKTWMQFNEPINEYHLSFSWLKTILIRFSNIKKSWESLQKVAQIEENHVHFLSTLNFRHFGYCEILRVDFFLITRSLIRFYLFFQRNFKGGMEGCVFARVVGESIAPFFPVVRWM